MRANVSATTAFRPAAPSATGACSREDPQPKFLPATMIAAGEVAVGGRDADRLPIDPPDGVARPAEARRARGVERDLAAGVPEDVEQRAAVDGLHTEPARDVRSGGHEEGVDRHAPAVQHARRVDEVGDLPARARADVGTRQLDVAELARQGAVVGRMWLRDRGLERARVVALLDEEARARVVLDRREGPGGAAAQVGARGLVAGDDA